MLTEAMSNKSSFWLSVVRLPEHSCNVIANLLVESTHVCLSGEMWNGVLEIIEIF